MRKLIFFMFAIFVLNQFAFATGGDGTTGGTMRKKSIGGGARAIRPSASSSSSS